MSSKSLVFAVGLLIAAAGVQAQWTPTNPAPGAPISYTNGNVGVGTASPSVQLHTYASSGQVVAGVQAGAANFAGIYTSTLGNGNALFWDANSVMRLGTANALNPTSFTERIRINAAGNLGLSTTSIAPWYSLHAFEGPSSALAIGDVGDLHVLSNAYFDNGGWKYKTSSVAANYYAYNGMHVFRVATAGTANAAVNWIDAMAIDNNGSVGIGTTAPTAGMKLDVNGSARVASSLTVGGSVTVTGDITGAHVINATYQDVAEWVSVSSELEPATVVVLDRSAVNQVTPSTHSYDTTVAGVVSANPGIVLGEAAASKAKIATTGRVRVRVDATSTAIAIGDLLVTSDVAGTAMKSQPMELNGRSFHQPGTIIGKALEPLKSGRGEILVLLSLQ